MPSAKKRAPRENGQPGNTRNQTESLSQPSLRNPSYNSNNRENNQSRLVPRTQSFDIAKVKKARGISTVSDLLGSILPPTKFLQKSVNSESAPCRSTSAKSQSASDLNNQDNLSIDIDEELARLELETYDDFPSSSAGTVNHDKTSTASRLTRHGNGDNSVCDGDDDDDVNCLIQELGDNDSLDQLAPLNKVNQRDSVPVENNNVNEAAIDNNGNDAADYVDKLQEQVNAEENIKNELFDASNKLGLQQKDKKDTPSCIIKRQQHTLIFLSDPSLSSALEEVTQNNNLNYEHKSSSHTKVGSNNNSELNDMERNKGQANGSVSQPGPSRVPGARSDVTIPGAVQDTSQLRAELLAAVEQNKLEKARRILKAGVDANAVCDDKGRFPLHVAAFFGFTKMCKLLLDHGAQKDQPDTALERTPLLYAAATSPDTVKLLLHYKADIHSKNRFGAGALHYAAGASQGECCRILASVGCDVNQRDRQKMTPLHMAARVDDIWSIEVLLEFNADVHARDVLGKTCLMHAAETSEGMISDHKKMGATFRRLIAAGVDVNATDHDGKNALYYAVQTGSPEAVTILHELGAELIDGVSLLTMGRRFPALIPPFLDKCVSSNVDTCDAESKHFYIQFDYTCLTFYPKDIPDEKLLTMQHRDETESVLAEMGVLHGLTRCKDSSILSHPVCESLLRLKWKKVKWYLYLDMLLFAVFLAFLTAVIFMEYESDSSESVEIDNLNLTSTGNTTRGVGDPPESHRSSYCMDSTRNIVVWVILWVLTACLGIREMVQLIQSPLHYMVQVENILELVLVFSVAMLSLAECGVQSFVNARDHFAAVCLIVGWTIQVTLYGKIPVFGVYIRMFAAVATNILKCLFTYLGLLFAFSLTLHFLFRSQKEFDSVGFTFLKTFAMMIGEIELARTFIDNRDNTYIVPFTSHLMFALFIIFISVILMSLLVALAVCDIASMQREGEYMQLVQQVKVASQLEDALQHRGLLYPQFGMKDQKALHQRKGVIFPNLKDHGKLGKDALEIVITLHAKKLDASNANAISQQIHMDEKDMMKSTTFRATNEMADDLLQKLKAKMDMYAVEVEKRNDQFFQDFRGNQERGNLHLNREILNIRSHLDDIVVMLRDVNDAVKALGERSMYESSSSPTRGRKRNRSGGGTGTDYNPTSPELEVTETSTQSSPEPSNQHSRQQTNTSSPSRNPSPSPAHRKRK